MIRHLSQGCNKIPDLDIDPCGHHDKIDAHPDETSKIIPLNPGGAAWEPE